MSIFPFKFTALLLAGLFVATSASADISEYTLVIDQGRINIDGKSRVRLTLNGSLPGPTLKFTEGDEAVIHVENRLDEETALHWHGLLLPENMDGVPGIGGFAAIRQGGSFTYRFKIRQHGTYWYHAHSRGQEQDGLYGAIVITPADPDVVQADRDYVVLISDFHEDAAADIYSNLKMSSDYYQYQRRTVGDFFADIRDRGLRGAWDKNSMWGRMRMLPTDLADVSGYTFLVNGLSPQQNWTGLFNAGERVRLRFINASAMSFYDVRIPGLPMMVVAADGRDIEPVTIDEFRFGVAETYDVIITPGNQAYTIAAESIDRTGFALGTLAPKAGVRGPLPEQRARTLLTMADMPHVQADTGDDTAVVDHAAHGSDQATAGQATENTDYTTGVPGSGWAVSGAPAGTRILAYTDLRSQRIQEDTRDPGREIEIRLGGNMERYIWTLNGSKFSASEQAINLAYGERVRLKFVNDTMMAHPMHLHGMFVQLENGQPAAKLPDKHTVIVAPGDSYSVLLTADEPGEWAFHCHLLYHTLSGMMNKAVVARLDESGTAEEKSVPAQGQGEQHHVH